MAEAVFDEPAGAHGALHIAIPDVKERNASIISTGSSTATENSIWVAPKRSH